MSAATQLQVDIAEHQRWLDALRREDEAWRAFLNYYMMRRPGRNRPLRLLDPDPDCEDCQGTGEVHFDPHAPHWGAESPDTVIKRCHCWRVR